MTFRRRRFIGHAALAALAAAAVSAPVSAQSDWPNRAIRLIVPYTPGGSSDIIARAISGPLGEVLGQTVVVDNRPGANGNLGAGVVAQADDNHTLLLCDVGALAISPSVYTKLSFDPSRDLRGVSMLAYSPHLLAVHPSVPAKTLQELVALSQKQQLNFAVTAVGSAPHVAAVALDQATRAKWHYVPYKGGSQAITDTVGGQTQVVLNGMLATLPHVQSGKLRAIAISKRERMPLAPELPTLAEQGVAGFESGSWQGILAPASMPQAARERLAKALAQIVQRPDISKRLNDQGAEIVIQGPAEMDAFFAKERARWADVVKKGNISLE